jgi:hypothetical protein
VGRPKRSSSSIRSNRAGCRGREHRADREQHVAQRCDRVPPQPLVDAQQRVGQLEVGERPQAEHRDIECRRIAVAEHDAAHRAREPGQQDRRHRRGHEHEADRPPGERVAALGVLI